MLLPEAFQTLQTPLAALLIAAVTLLARLLVLKRKEIASLKKGVEEARVRGSALGEIITGIVASQTSEKAAISALQCGLHNSDPQFAHQVRELEQVALQKRVLESAVAKAAEELSSVRQELEQRTVQIAELRFAFSESERARQYYQDALASTRKDLDVAEVDLTAVRSKFAQQQEGLAKAQVSLTQTEEQLSAAQTELTKLQEHVKTTEKLDLLRERLAVFEEQHELVSSGLYPVSLDFGTPDDLRNRLEGIRSQLADMVRNKSAAICVTKWKINGSAAEGTKATRHYIRIMLRTFNADADACLDLVRWNNLEKCEARLRASFEYVNDLGSTHSTQLQEPYLELRLTQLRLMHQFRESVHRQKEALRAARQAALEERRANREIERARAGAEAEERRYSKALDRAHEEMLILVGHEREQMRQTILDLEARLAQASLLKQRAISMAQITKAGFVYVVSNMGSFGADVVKIGMTRRIDPQERIRELGGASVPFHFDVHAMIYSENAPELENLFHRRFSRLRLNLANGRKEFFRVGLDEVVNYAKELKLEAEFSSQAEARDFHISNQIRGTFTDEEIANRLELLAAQASQEHAHSEDDDSDLE